MVFFFLFFFYYHATTLIYTLLHPLSRPAALPVLVARPCLLQDPPQAVDIVPCVSPIALRVEMAEVEMALQPMGDAGDGAADLAGDEGLSPRRPLEIGRAHV